MKISYLFLFRTLIIGCAEQIFSNQPKLVYEDGYHFGHLNKSIIQEHDAYTWFSKQYDKYQPMLEKIDTNALNETDIVVFMGTWCHDSKREVPRMLRILDSAGVGTEQISLIGVDTNKAEPKGREKLYNLRNTPTLILLKNGKEVGRIIERPNVSLEADLIGLTTKSSEPVVED